MSNHPLNHENQENPSPLPFPPTPWHQTQPTRTKILQTKKKPIIHMPLGILVWAREDRADLDVPTQEAELVPGLQHARAVGLVVVHREGEGGS